MNTAEQVKQVEALRGTALRERFREVTGLETRSNNRPYLIKRIVDALQAGANGTEDHQAAAATTSTGDAAALTRLRKSPVGRKSRGARIDAKRARDPRIPAPGTVLEREHDGKKIRAKILDDGFEYRSKTYRSLSAIAREATNVSWNGLLFFRLIPYAKRDK
jgi:hypothetical protein